MQYDVAVIGAGPGGYVAAIRAAQLGFKTAIVEGHKVGGECLNYGCIPSKALISASHLIDRINHGSEMGITVSGLKIDQKKLYTWKEGIVQKLTGGVGSLLKANKVDSFVGLGVLKGLSADGRLKQIEINAAVDSYDNTKASKSGKQTIEAHRVIVATGSETVEIPSFKFNGKTILSSKQALDVQKTPERIVVIGGGFIGLEIGTFYAKLGVSVTVVEATGTLLPGTDKECVRVVQQKLKKRGVEVLLETKALSVEDSSSGALVNVENFKGETQSLECDWVLVTVGRKPRSKFVGLENIGIGLDGRGFVDVNSRLETSIPGVFAIGDIVKGPMLAHKASKEGLVAVEGMKNPGIEMNLRALPWAIFVDPEIAVVGHTEESARESGWDPVVGKCPFAANGRALTTMESDGFVKIIADRKTDEILGAHMVGPEVSNLVAEVAMAIEMGATAEDLSRTVHAHPTLPETIMEAAENVHGMAIHIYSPKRNTK